MFVFKDHLILHIITTILVLFGGLTSLIRGISNSDVIASMVGKDISNFILILIGLSALFQIIQKQTFLPIEGPVVMPTDIFADHNIPSDFSDDPVMQITVDIDPLASKIIYWSDDDSILEDYLSFVNTKNVVVDDISPFEKSSKKKELTLKRFESQDIYYRLIYKNGIIGRVITVNHE